MPTCSRSTLRISRSSGSTRAWTYRVAAVTWPKRHPAIHIADAAEDQHHDQRCVVREADHDEQQVAQRHRVTLGLRGHRDVLIAALDPTRL